MRSLIGIAFTLIYICTLIASNATVRAASEPALPLTVDFNRDIRPIFSDNCYACHGPDKNKRKADLRLDTHDGVFSTIKDHTMVIAGKPEESELYRRVIAANPDERMPDPKSNKRLSDREIAVIRKWVEQGAPWKGHWAYIKPAKSTPADSGQLGFVRNPIDNFVLARMKEAGLSPAAQADRPTLIRRLSFDLIGLPPTPKEVDAFVADNSPDAYEKVVDHLLASPHFGERMAVFWLDLVRYADSIGYHSDNPMDVTPYRDYVIKAFNDNKPFDQFTVEQLAGDLLPNSTTEQKVATAYNRLLQTTEEGGAQPKEYEVKYLTDRVRNVSTVWMGATMGCCQCHDHKFDPFSMNDFYSMGAFFADVQEADTGHREPGMPVPTAEQDREIASWDKQIAEAKQKLETDSPELAVAQADWEKHYTDQVEWITLDPESWKVVGESKLKKEADGILKTFFKVAAKESYAVTTNAELKGVTGFRLEVLPDDELPSHGPGTAPNGNFVLTEFTVAVSIGEGKQTPIKLAIATADHSQDNYSIASAIDGKRAAGWAILPQVGKPHAAVFETESPLFIGNTTLTFTLNFQSPFPQHNIGKFRLSMTTSPSPASKEVAPAPVKEALKLASDKRSEPQKNLIAAYYRTIAPGLQPIRLQITKLTEAKLKILETVPKCLVTTAANPRTVRFLHRGNWLDSTGDIMTPGIPKFLASKELQDEATKRRLTRLDLARWLVSRDNPLTARVYANRIWRLYFGTGISKVMDDLGSQGEWPTHPELLDFLAVQFMEKGWDTKQLVKLIVTSSTYRQSSKPSDLDKEKDPYNRLLAHQSRWRLDAEFVRDDALSIGGLLTETVSGPSAKPYQPAGYWDQLNFPTRTYTADKGEDQYRRGLYTWWQRSFLHPSLAAFDAPSHEEAVCERNRSNIPQQSLALLNDPTYVEASRAFAIRIMREGGATVEDRLSFAYQVALARKPRIEEVSVLSDLYAKHLKQYSTDTGDAQKLLGVGQLLAPKDLNPSELASWTSVARVILNLHETITRM